MSTLQNNVIERNMRAGVVVTDTANPTLAVNIIRDGEPSPRPSPSTSYTTSPPPPGLSRR